MLKSVYHLKKISVKKKKLEKKSKFNYYFLLQCLINKLISMFYKLQYKVSGIEV
jgi:hypothetical protein